MSKCSECTNLNTSNTNLYGKYWCEEHEKYVFLNNDACDKFSWEIARQSFLDDEYKRFLDKSFYSCSSIEEICKTLGMPKGNDFLMNIKELMRGIVQADHRYKNMIMEYSIVDSRISECLGKDPMKKRISLELFFKYIEPINALIKNNMHEDAANRLFHMSKLLEELYRINLESIKENKKLIYK